MSPRRTQALHDASYCQHLRTVVLIGLQPGRFGGQGFLVPVSCRCFDQGQSDRLGTGQARCLELA